MESSPKIRAVEAFPIQSEGEELVCLRDPEGYAKNPILLNRYLAFLVSRMDGENSLRDIQADFLRATGELLPMEQLEQLVQQLDEQHFLDSEAFRAFHGALVQEFLDSPVRAPQHAGSAYEGDAGPLRNQIGEFFECSEGPGKACAAPAEIPIRGLIAPHIDFHRGGPAYAHAYRTLAVKPGPDRFILFGTCHNPMQGRFALTLKHFDTPLGPVENDREFVRKLAGRLPVDYFRDEYAHRAEHSLEFQTVFLKYLHGVQDSFKIVPILVGSFHDIYECGRSAAEEEELGVFVEAVRSTVEEFPARYAVIAAADLAHVGRRFGDEDDPTPESLAIVEREDRRFLEHVAAGDAEAMFRLIAAEGDQRHVCGYPPIYMTLRCIDNPRGKLLKYNQWSDFESGAAVTFAAMALY